MDMGLDSVVLICKGYQEMVESFATMEKIDDIGDEERQQALYAAHVLLLSFSDCDGTGNDDDLLDKTPESGYN